MVGCAAARGGHTDIASWTVCRDCYRVGHVAGTDGCDRLRLLPLGIAVRYPDVGSEISLGERNFRRDIGWHRMGWWCYSDESAGVGCCVCAGAVFGVGVEPGLRAFFVDPERQSRAGHGGGNLWGGRRRATTGSHAAQGSGISAGALFG